MLINLKLVSSTALFYVIIHSMCMLQCVYITKPCLVPFLSWPLLGGQLGGLRCDLSVLCFCNTNFFSHYTPTNWTPRRGHFFCPYVPLPYLHVHLQCRLQGWNRRSTGTHARMLFILAPCLIGTLLENSSIDLLWKLLLATIHDGYKIMQSLP